MISVIIPLMRLESYEMHLEDCIKSLERQTCRPEIIVSEHGIEDHIRKNYLLNRGFEKAAGDIIFHCDVDFTIEDDTTLERMSERLTDVIYPVFVSDITHKLKIADGGTFARKSVLERFGPLDESLIGINYVTFPLLLWCMENTDFKVYNDFIIIHNKAQNPNKVHRPTKRKLVDLFKQTQANAKYDMPQLL